MDHSQNPVRPTRGRIRAGLLVLAVGALLAAAVGIAWATGAAPAMLGHGACKAGMARDFVDFRIHRALRQVDASEQQEQQIMAIVDRLAARHEAMAGVHHAMHEQLLAALTGDTVDRDAIEAVRVQAVTQLTAASRELAGALADIAEVLTPEQRQQLAALAKQHMQQ